MIKTTPAGRLVWKVVEELRAEADANKKLPDIRRDTLRPALLPLLIPHIPPPNPANPLTEIMGL